MFARVFFAYLFSLCVVCLLTSTAYCADKYVFILSSLTNPYWQTVKQGIEDESKKTGITSTILTATNDQAPEDFLNLCQSAISQKPSIMVLGSPTTAVGLQCLREAQNHGIKVALLDAEITVADAKKSGILLSYSVGTNNSLLGDKGAQFVAANSVSASPKVLIIEGMVGSINNAHRVTGFKQGLARYLPKAKIVNCVSAEWDRLKALNITADTITRTPDLNVVFAANDMMALGAVEAIRNAGKTNQILVIGVDGVAEARKSILAGRMSCSVAQIPYLIGKRSVDLAQQSLHGQCFQKTEQTPLLVLTKNVLESKTDPLLRYVR
jgi:D-allose transport system substrate-binding protein